MTNDHQERRHISPKSLVLYHILIFWRIESNLMQWKIWTNYNKSKMTNNFSNYVECQFIFIHINSPLQRQTWITLILKYTELFCFLLQICDYLWAMCWAHRFLCQKNLVFVTPLIIHKRNSCNKNIFACFKYIFYVALVKNPYPLINLDSNTLILQIILAF